MKRAKETDLATLISMTAEKIGREMGKTIDKQVFDPDKPTKDKRTKYQKFMDNLREKIRDYRKSLAELIYGEHIDNDDYYY